MPTLAQEKEEFQEYVKNFNPVPSSYGAEIAAFRLSKENSKEPKYSKELFQSWVRENQYFIQNINNQDSLGLAPLHHLVQFPEYLEILEQESKKSRKKIDYDIKDQTGATPAAMAAGGNCIESLKFLKAKGADFTLKNNEGEDLLDEVFKVHAPERNRNLTEVATFLVRQGLDTEPVERKLNEIKDQNRHKYSLLSHIKQKKVEMENFANDIKENSASKTKQNPYGAHIAALVKTDPSTNNLIYDKEFFAQFINDNPDCLKYVNTKNPYSGQTMIHYLSYHPEHLAILAQECKERGIKVNYNIADNDGYTPAANALSSGTIESLKFLHKQGVDFTKQPKNLLDIAVQEHKPDFGVDLTNTAMFLVEKGCRLDDKTKNLNTAHVNGRKELLDQIKRRAEEVDLVNKALLESKKDIVSLCNAALKDKTISKDNFKNQMSEKIKRQVSQKIKQQTGVDDSMLNDKLDKSLDKIYAIVHGEQSEDKKKSKLIKVMTSIYRKATRLFYSQESLIKHEVKNLLKEIQTVPEPKKSHLSFLANRKPTTQRGI